MDNPKDMQERAAGAAFTPNECQRCGNVGGKIVAFSFGAVSQARWVCPHCLDAATNLVSVLSALLDDMEDKYDGAPDSGSRWMGWHISKGREALAKAGSK